MRYPWALFRPLGKQTEPRMKAHDIICLHTMVGYLGGTDAMFRANGYGGTESHFGIGGRWGTDRVGLLDGAIWQWQDTGHQADANMSGGHRVISIETADNAPKTVEAIEEWTPKQCRSLAELIAWLCLAYDIPPTLIPDTKPGRRGIGYHRQGCEHSEGVGARPGYLVKGGERWSSSRGKGCPGPKRIAQITKTIIPMVLSILDGGDMTPDDWTKLKAVLNAELVKVLTLSQIVENQPLDKGAAQGRNWTTASVLAAADRKTDLQGRTLAALTREVGAIRAAQEYQAETLATILTILNADPPDPLPDAA